MSCFFLRTSEAVKGPINNPPFNNEPSIIAITTRQLLIRSMRPSSSILSSVPLIIHTFDWQARGGAGAMSRVWFWWTDHSCRLGATNWLQISPAETSHIQCNEESSLVTEGLMSSRTLRETTLLFFILSRLPLSSTSSQSAEKLVLQFVSGTNI